MTKTMKVKGLSCQFNMPQQLRESKLAHSLPPYAQQSVFAVDEYPACPDNWMNGSDIASSYFVGVEEGHGMWLDFNGCFSHTHEVAIVLSVQGINPVTGQKMVGKEALRLEQYKTKCPIHDVPFQQDRFCPECQFKWPAQNYLSTTGTPLGLLWLDGFRTPDGKVRQYIITADEKKGVAAQIIGDDRVFAIGAAFYLSKKKKETKQWNEPKDLGPDPHALLNIGWQGWDKPYPHHNVIGSLFKSVSKGIHSYGSSSSSASSSSTSWSSSVENRTRGRNTGGNIGAQNVNNTQPMFFSPLHTTEKWSLGDNLKGAIADAMHEPIRASLQADEVMLSASMDGFESFSGTDVTDISDGTDIADFEPRATMDMAIESVTPVKNFEIGAGAMINQLIYEDTLAIEDWQETPAGMIFINYCDPETKKKILAAGKRKEAKQGFLQGLAVGGK